MEKDEKQQATCGSNPWKGLNFYLEGETLYGRSEEIGSLSQYIINNTQTILYGRSGIGKSSIIYAGVFIFSWNGFCARGETPFCKKGSPPLHPPFPKNSTETSL